MAERSKLTEPIREEKRGSFRINDSLPVVVHRIEAEADLAQETETVEIPFQKIPSAPEEETLASTLWKMLVNLDRKLDRIMERIPVDLSTTKFQPVNLSSTGLKIKVRKNFDLHESLRIKMLLPTVPAKELLLTGKVVRIETLPDGTYVVALHFQNMDDTVRNEIIQYTLNQQRKILAAQKQKRGQE